LGLLLSGDSPGGSISMDLTQPQLMNWVISECTDVAHVIFECEDILMNKLTISSLFILIFEYLKLSGG